MNGLGASDRDPWSREPGSPPVVIAVDGPAASGKSTLARRLAAAFRPRLPRHRPALPRGRPAPCSTPAGVRRRAGRGGRGDAALAPEDVAAGRLRGEGVGQGASRVAAVPEVRDGAAAVPAPVRHGRRRRGAGRPRHRHGGLPRCRLQAVRHRQRPRSGRGGGSRSCGPRRCRPIYAAFWRSCGSVTPRCGPGGRAVAHRAADAWVLDTTDLDVETALAFARACRGSSTIARSVPASRRRSRARQPETAERSQLTTLNPSRGQAAADRPCAGFDIWSQGMTGSHSKPSSRRPRPTISPRCSTRRCELERPARRHASSRGTVVGIDDDKVIVDVGLKSEGRVPAQGIRGARAAARGPGRRHRSRCSSSGSRTKSGEVVPQPREGAARGELEPARARVQRHQQGRGLTSSAGSRAASRSISAVPWPSCRAARSTSGRCATSAR